MLKLIKVLVAIAFVFWLICLMYDINIFAAVLALFSGLAFVLKMGAGACALIAIMHGASVEIAGKPVTKLLIGAVLLQATSTLIAASINSVAKYPVFYQESYLIFPALYLTLLLLQVIWANILYEYELYEINKRVVGR